MKSSYQQLLEKTYSKMNRSKKKKRIMKEGISSEQINQMDGFELMETWMDKNGVRFDDEQDLTNLIEVLGYRQGLREFFGDNPGAIEALFNWISENIDNVTDWKENLRDELADHSAEDEEETPETSEDIEVPER